jgi:P-type E1-E2 ATPase
MKIPCDAILYDGEALLNEASLTGEIVPVAKYALPDSDTMNFSYANCQK